MKFSEPKIIIFTGSGLSAESGVSTFRGKSGLWENHPIEQICNENTWLQNYALVHRFYNALRSDLARVEPNAAHDAIARIQQNFDGDVLVITQNVDDLLERAGVVDVLHLHGKLTELQCDDCGYCWDIGYAMFDASANHQSCPSCDCNDMIKPNVVFFGGRALHYETLYEWLEQANHPDSIFIVRGTQGNVVPIDALLADTLGYKILNNLEPSVYIDDSHFDKVYFEPASQAWLKIEEYLDQNWLGV